MIIKKTFAHRWPKLLLLVFFLMGGVLTAQAPKLQKNGKLKAKKHKVADHHNKEVKKDKHHKAEWNQHNNTESQSFSKKKKKKK